MKDDMNSDKPLSGKLKGVGDSFWITLDPSLPEDIIKKDLDVVFQRLKHLAIGANVVIDMDGARGHEDLLNALKRYLQETYSVGKVTSSPEKRSVPCRSSSR